MGDSAEQLAEYEEQLSGVEELLQDDPSNEEFVSLKGDLLELITITKELVASEVASSSDSAGAAVAAAPQAEAIATIPVSEQAGAGDEAGGGGGDEAPAAAQQKKKAAPVYTSTSEFVIPDNLKIQNTDTEEEKLKKRKKVKGLKLKFKRSVGEAVVSEKQQSWQDFVGGGKKKKKRKGTSSTNEVRSN
jgi:survival-of-motor-neuron-related-splicing factor 30